MRLPRPASALTPVIAAGAPVAGWEVTAGLMAVLLTVTACLVVLMKGFAAQTPRRRHDVIELVRAWRAGKGGDRPVESRQPAAGDDADADADE